MTRCEPTVARAMLGIWRAILFPIVILLPMVVPMPASAQGDDGWVGKRVVGKYADFQLRSEDLEVIDARMILTYRVERVDGPWLWVKAEGRGISGWAWANHVVPVEDAIAFFTDSIQADAGDTFSYLMRAIVRLREKKDVDNALADLNEAVRLEPTWASTWNLRGFAWYEKKEYDKAIADYSEAIRLVPNSAGHYNDRSASWLGKKDYDKAIDDLNQAIQLDPKDATAYSNRSAVWEAKKDYDRAIADLSEAIRLDPEFATAYNNRGSTWRAKKDYNKAIADYSEAIRLDPKFVLAYRNRGIVWRAKKEYDRAIADDSEAIRLDPKDARAYNNRGIAWRAKKEYDNSIADFSEAIRLDPKSIYAYYGRALTLLLARREGGAESAWQGLEIAGWHGKQALYTVIIGHLAAVQAGQGDRAKTFLDDAALKCDRETWPYPIVKFLRGEIDEAALLASATDDDQRTEVHGYVGFALLLKGQTEPARRHFLWVKEHGNPAFTEYTIALTELERLEKKPAASEP